MGRDSLTPSEKKLKHRYGITLDDYYEMLDLQGNSCAICYEKAPQGRGNGFVVDHCHVSGKVRGILCHKCNTAIGLLQEHPEVFESAVDYLLKED